MGLPNKLATLLGNPLQAHKKLTLLCACFILRKLSKEVIQLFGQPHYPLGEKNNAALALGRQGRQLVYAHRLP
jgi:hypothetical protein